MEPHTIDVYFFYFRHFRLEINYFPLILRKQSDNRQTSDAGWTIEKELKYLHHFIYISTCTVEFKFNWRIGKMLDS